jgi:5'-nucleotidase/UDP-sugar diphosphatase
MRRALPFALAFSLLATLSVYGQTDTVTILHLNDTHSNLAPIGPRDSSLIGSLGGIARAATLIGMERMADPKALLLHAGDFSVGDLFYNKYFGAVELQILATLGCNAITLGNHEFDLTPSTLLAVLDNAFSGAGFPVLCANINLEDPAVQPLKRYVTPYTIRQVGNVKVGIFGLTTPETNLISQPAPAVIDTPFLPAAAMVDTLMTEGCNVIVCLSHLGFSLDKMIAETIPGINVIVGGHDHFAFEEARPVQNPSGDTTWIVQANAFYLDLGKVRLTVSAGKVRLLDYMLIPITEAIPEEPSVKASVDWMIGDIESVYGPVYTAKIADVNSFFKEVADSLTSGGPHDTPIGNLVTDAFRATTGTQIAMEVGGSTAEPLYPGPIVAADAFRVVGYGYNTVNGLGYRLVTFEIAGAALYAGLEFGLSNIEQDDEFLVQVSGMKYSYRPTLPAFARVTSVEVGGAPLDLQAMYTVTANEFVPMFLNLLGIPYANAHVCGDTTEFSALAGYIQQLGTLTPQVEGRVFVPPTGIVSPHNSNEIASTYELSQNYPNPFNPKTGIRYSVPTQSGRDLVSTGGRDGQVSGVSNVKITVYDLLGREIAVLVNERKAAGTYEVSFDGGGLASGVYLYRLTAGSFSAVKKMVLLK